MSRWNASCQNVRVKIWVTVEQSGTNQPFRSGDGPRMVWAKGGVLPRGARLDWRWKWRHRWTSPRFSDGCNETSPFNGKTPSHSALRFFIFTGRSFLCFIIVLNLFELQSFYVRQFRHSSCRMYMCACVCVAWKKLSIFFFFFSILRNSTRLRVDPKNFEIEAMKEIKS